MHSKILLEDVKIYAYHGVLPEERTIGTYFIINAELHADLWKAAESDDLNDTLNYAEINEIIHEEMKIPSDLLEHVVGRIIGRLHAEFPQIDFIRLKLTKTGPPMRGEMKGVSIEMQKSFK
ncbi:MAG: dihydroneopterin aldolase [Chryseobacterium sp.]|nr:MAG: dihydroneopterin aldolase [Chryseobacterium sp.]